MSVVLCFLSAYLSFGLCTNIRIILIRHTLGRKNFLSGIVGAVVGEMRFVWCVCKSCDSISEKIAVTSNMGITVIDIWFGII